MSQGQLSCHIQFLIGIVHIVHLVHEPCITIGIGVLQGNGLSALQRQDEIFRIQHVQHGVNAVAIHLRHIASGLAHCIVHAIDLLIYMSIDEFLIAAQLGSMISANALQIERRLIFVEGRRGQIQHTIVERFILQDMINGRRLRHRCLALRLGHKQFVVQVTLVHRPHVNQTKHQDDTHGILLLQLAKYYGQQHASTY